MSEEQPKYETGKNIYQRINEVRKKVHYVQKDKEVKGHGYKAVTHDNVTAICRNHLIDQGIVFVPRLTGSTMNEVGSTKTGTPIYRYAALYEIDVVNIDNPTDKITVTAEAHANDSGDKAPGKATSYATKYVMLKLFSIETGESEESRHDVYGADETVTAEQVAIIEKLIIDTESDPEKFKAHFKVETVADLKMSQYKQARALLAAKGGGK